MPYGISKRDMITVVVSFVTVGAIAICCYSCKAGAQPIPVEAPYRIAIQTPFP